MAIFRKLLREQAVRDADVAVGAETPEPAVALEDLLLGLRVLGQALDEGVDALAGKRPGRERDFVARSDRDADLGRHDDGLLPRRQRSRDDDDGSEERRREARPSPRRGQAHPESRRPPRTPAPRRTSSLLRSAARESALRGAGLLVESPDGNRDRRQARERCRNGEDVREVHRQRVVGLLADLEGRPRNRGAHDDVDVGERAGRSRPRGAARARVASRSTPRSSRRRARTCRAGSGA